jgi:hypothetical protein
MEVLKAALTSPRMTQLSSISRETFETLVIFGDAAKTGPNASKIRYEGKLLAFFYVKKFEMMTQKL